MIRSLIRIPKLSICQNINFNNNNHNNKRIAIQSTRQYARQRRSSSISGRYGGNKLLPNPGLQRQAQNLSESPDKLFEPDDPEDLSQVETDFLNLDKSHKKYQQETIEHNENIKLKTIERKYFKKEQINFLTWSEKEQIRQLNTNDPEDWSVERLAESFPANEETIIKILKSKWQPINFKRIHKHDLAVQENWKLFLQDTNNGLLANDLQLREHLKKFSTNRMLISKMKKNKFSKINLLEIQKPKSQEFSNILLGCGKYKEIEQKQIVDKIKNNNDILNDQAKNIKDSRQLKDTYLLEKSKNTKPLMFKELVDVSLVEQTTEKTKIINQHNPFKNPLDQINGNLTDNNSNFIEPSNTIMVKKYESNEILPIDNDEHIKSMTTPFILENIDIPKRLYKKGATYKFNDCYYDDDGEFLYRVPGMTGHNN